MKYGAYQLSDVTTDKVVIECDLCGRRGEYVTARLIAQHGADIGMPDLRSRIVGQAGCANLNPNTLQGCKARFADETVQNWIKPR